MFFQLKQLILTCVCGFFFSRLCLNSVPLLLYKPRLHPPIGNCNRAHFTEIRVKTEGALAPRDRRCHLAQYISLPPPPISSASLLSVPPKSPNMQHHIETESSTLALEYFSDLTFDCFIQGLISASVQLG